MASKWYLEGLRQVAAEGNYDELDVRCKLLMSNTTADTEDDGKTNLDDFTTLDVCDDTGYSEQSLANEAVNKDEANNRIEFDGDDLTFANNGDASRTVVGVLYFIYVDGTLANDIPLHWGEFALAITLDGSTLNVQHDAEGIAQATQA